MLAQLRKTATPGVTGIGVDAEGIAVVQLVPAPDRPPTFLAGEYAPYTDITTLNASLHTLANKYRLRKAYCSSVLEGADYKLLLTEAPDVPSEELPAALRWRIKDLVDIPVSDIIMDIIRVPSIVNGSRGNSVFVVAAHNRVIQQRVEILQEAKINLQVIDIAEIAQRNIAALLPEDKAGLATLSMRAQHSLITLTRDNELYMSRTLNIGANDISNPQQRETAFNQIVLEIQRSLDYYESHFRQPPVRTLALLPLPHTSAELVDFLGRNLSVEVKAVDLSELVTPKVALPAELQAKLYLAFGAALRMEAN